MFGFASSSVLWRESFGRSSRAAKNHKRDLPDITVFEAHVRLRRSPKKIREIFGNVPDINRTLGPGQFHGKRPYVTFTIPVWVYDREVEKMRQKQRDIDAKNATPVTPRRKKAGKANSVIDPVQVA